MSVFKNCLRFLKWGLVYKITINKFHVNTMDFEETVNLILEKKLSVSRFGDGEFRFLLSEDTGNTFEVNSNDLARSLKMVLNSRDKDNLLICLPSVYSGLNGLKFEEKIFWQREISLYLKKYYKYIDRRYVYGDAFFSRPYQGYLINRNQANEKFKLISQIWNNRNVIIVEGKLTRFGVNNDLLNNAKSVERILAPAINAFEKIDSIYKAIKDNLNDQNKDDILVLLSLGPTATILATTISNNLNVQSVDIGHLDIEYEWFIRKETKKVPIKGKYVNESASEKFINGKVDKKYLSEIICEIE